MTTVSPHSLDLTLIIQAPDIVNLLSLLSDHLHGGGFHVLVSSGENNNVSLELGSIFKDDAVLRDLPCRSRQKKLIGGLDLLTDLLSLLQLDFTVDDELGRSDVEVYE
jgi:hypothetical protein